MRLSLPARPLGDLLAELESFYGRGETYGKAERTAILAGQVPEWLYRVARFHPALEWRNHCANLIAQLDIAWREGWPAVSQSAPLGKITKNVSAPPPKLSADVRGTAGNKAKARRDATTRNTARRGW